jgi:hypothetical protein
MDEVATKLRPGAFGPPSHLGSRPQVRGRRSVLGREAEGRPCFVKDHVGGAGLVHPDPPQGRCRWVGAQRAVPRGGEVPDTPRCRGQVVATPRGDPDACDRTVGELVTQRAVPRCVEVPDTAERGDEVVAVTVGCDRDRGDRTVGELVTQRAVERRPEVPDTAERGDEIVAVTVGCDRDRVIGPLVNLSRSEP